METPTLFLIFNRPDTTAKVFEEIRKAKPKRLFIAADGPNQNDPESERKCLETRKIVENIDWDCEVKKLFNEKNLGCRKAVSSAISWFFDNVDRGIILEDDCLPNESFFRFCEEMLEKYEGNEKVSMITGTNFAGNWKSSSSYLFSKYGSIWGWATWKRAWKHYDLEMKAWENPETAEKLQKFFPKKQWLIRKKMFNDAYLGKINTWDYQWSFARALRETLSVVPSQNLIKNIGFREDATHTKKDNTLFSELSSKKIVFPLTDPEKVEVDHDYECFFERNIEKSTTFFKKIGNFFKKFFR